MFRKNVFDLFGYLIFSTVMVYTCFMGYLFLVANETAKLNNTDTQVEFTNLIEQEKQAFKTSYQFFIPAGPKNMVTVPISTVAIPTNTAFPTQTLVPTQTVEPTATVTPEPITYINNVTEVPLVIPTDYPEPSGDGWKVVYNFGGGPTTLIKADCYQNDLNDCIEQEVEIYLQGYQTNEVYLNGFDNGYSDPTWTIRLVPGSNRLTVPQANRIGIGNLTQLQVEETEMYGWYQACEKDSYDECICQTYSDSSRIYQSPYGVSYLTTIWFESEYSDEWFLNNYSTEESISIHSGEIYTLPEFNSLGWDISVMPMFGELPTPIPFQP